MKQEIHINEAAGKTLESIYCTGYDRNAYLLFTDGTFAVVVAESGYEGDVYAEGHNPADRLSDYELLGAGVMDQAEYDEIKAKEARERQAENERREQALYASLKAKYGE